MKLKYSSCLLFVVAAVLSACGSPESTLTDQASFPVGGSDENRIVSIVSYKVKGDVLKVKASKPFCAPELKLAKDSTDGLSQVVVIDTCEADSWGSKYHNFDLNYQANGFILVNPVVPR